MSKYRTQPKLIGYIGTYFAVMTTEQTDSKTGETRRVWFTLDKNWFRSLTTYTPIAFDTEIWTYSDPNPWQEFTEVSSLSPSTSPADLQNPPV